MGLKAALFVIAAGVGAYYAYSMMDSGIETDQPTEAATTDGATHPLPSASGSDDAPPSPQPLPVAKAGVEIKSLIESTAASASVQPKPVPLYHGPDGFIGVGVTYEDAF